MIRTLLGWCSALFLFGILEQYLSSIITQHYPSVFRNSYLSHSVLLVLISIVFIVFRVHHQTKIQHNIESALQNSEIRFQRLLELSREAIVIHNDCIIMYANEAAAELSGESHAPQLVGSSIFKYIHPDSQSECKERYQQKREGQPITVESMKDKRLLQRDGTIVFVDLVNMGIEHQGVQATLSIIKNITECTTTEARLKYIAYHDSLTDLPNRRMLIEKLDELLKESKDTSCNLGILYLDIDRFKFVNDSYGHSFGDEILKLISQRLQLYAGKETFLCRMGGDEFAILLPKISDISAAIELAKEITLAFEDPLRVENEKFFVTTSIGIAMFPLHGSDSDTLIKHVDTALYVAKELGGNTYQVYNHHMTEESLDKERLRNDLKLAIENEEFILLYQPKIDTQTGGLAGVEALIRWEHNNEIVPPSAFIPVAEESGLIVSIGQWVLRTACIQAVQWQRIGFSPVRIAVNVSARQFEDGSFAELVRTIMESTGLSPEWLEIEITESVIMSHPESMIVIIEKLKAMGIYISIDDFGTGYSSLNYLKLFKVDALKIDRSFVQDIPHDPGDEMIIPSIVNLAHNFNMRVVAEGVETEEQFRYLKEQGCDEVQGYLFCPPVYGEKCEEILRNLAVPNQVQAPEALSTGSNHSSLFPPC